MALYAAEYLRTALRCGDYIEIGGRKYLARPPDHLNDHWRLRILLAWMVLTGQCDAIKWYKQ